MTAFTYLALGDSYTIGEHVPFADAFPNQTIQFLRKADLREDKNSSAHGHVFASPEIIAKTGWTTGELIEAIGQTIFLPRYDMVSLLIGVNNQYRGRSIDEFKKEFEILLQMAIQFAGGIEKNVYVLSIPDWGVTPFAKDRDAPGIAKEIDQFNNICEAAATAFKTQFLNITDQQRMDANDATFLTGDELHPSGSEYKKWAVKLSELMLENFRKI